MATLTVQQIAKTGLVYALTAAAGGGDAFLNEGVRTFFHVKNADGTATTVTFVTQKTVEGLAVADLAVSVTNGTEQLVGPFPADVYNDANGLVQVTYSKVTSLTVNPFRL
ncbi:MAG TPA: hypothetical protein VJK02_17435 [Anaerolineales bacterium]|nr:hypothetical protein [Anaerolineales bacterium]